MRAWRCADYLPFLGDAHSEPSLSFESMTSSTTEVKRRNVALIGSSGGGTATLGHTEPLEFLRIVEDELERINEPVNLSRALFVSLDNGKGMDSASGDDRATLYQLSDQIQQVSNASLNEINRQVQEIEKTLAQDIMQDKIHGLIIVSCNVPLIPGTLKAAADKSIPVTGTGGTSVSLAATTFKLRLVGNAGGSVATTSLTKAISFSNALARDWNLQYTPWKSLSKSGKQKQDPTWRSVLNSCLPAFWGVALCKRLLTTPTIHSLLPDTVLLLEVLESFALPTTCAVVMATSRRKSPTVLMAAVLASMACQQSILAGLLAGWLVAILEESLLYCCILYWNVPATMTNLLTTGLVGVVVALFMFPVAVYLRASTHWLRTYVIPLLAAPRDDDYETLRILGMFLFGWLFCYGSKVGWYHSIFLPLILVEMELGDASLFGAMDELTLVLVSAGICAGTWLTGAEKDVALVKRGLTINLFCGDFIEVAYPFMEEHTLINIGGYLASGLSVAILSINSKSSAYVPFPLAISLADDWKRMTLASTVAVGVSFLATVTNHILVKGKRKDE